MRRERLLPIFFIFMLISASFMIIPVAHASAPVKYSIYFYDQQGRRIDPKNPNIQKYASVVVYQVGWLSFLGKWFKKVVFTSNGDISGTFTADANTLEIHFFWLGKDVYSNTISTASAEKINGINVIHFDMPFTPAVPIEDFKVESIQASADMHEISTKFYSVQFGTGSDKNNIKITMGGNSYTVPVELGLSKGSTSNTKPFRFLAQSTSGYVEGKEAFLIWTTGYYYSAVRTQLVGDNMLLVVWTYGYTDITGPWIKTMVASAIAGAAVGAVSGVGSIAMAGVATVADAVVWAIKPDLMKGAGDTGIGVVAGIFTPRYFIIQGAGTGNNGTQGTVIMNLDGVNAGRGTWNGISYEISTGTNQIQVGFTKDWGTEHTWSMDFENGVGDCENFTQSQTVAHTGIYSGTVPTTGSTSTSSRNLYRIRKIMDVREGTHYKVTYQYYVYTADGTYTDDYDFALEYEDGTVITHKYYSGISSKWNEVSGEIEFQAQKSGSVYLYLSDAKRDGNTAVQTIYYDDITISYQDTGAYRYIFDTSQSDTTITRHIFGTIPAITPTRQGTEIHQRFTLLGVELLNPNATIALDWNSRIVEISPTRLVVKTSVWTETAWIFGTDDKDGFKNVSFVYVDPELFIYRTSIQSMYYFSGPGTWPVAPNWTPLVANNTTIFIPNGWGIPPWAVWNYNLRAWWESIGTLGHLAIYGLALLIILIIILVIAPWSIIAIFKILKAIIRAIIKGMGAVVKGISGGKKRHRR